MRTKKKNTGFKRPVSDWELKTQVKKQQTKNKTIETIVSLLVSEYNQDSKIKLQLMTKNFLRSIAPDGTLSEGSVDTEKFQSVYAELIKFLQGQMNKATANNPAENFLHPLEIKLVIIENPKLLEKCENLPDDVQNFAYELSCRNIQYIRHPLPALVRSFLAKFPFDVSMIPLEHIPPLQYINAINKGYLSVERFDKAAFLETLKQDDLDTLTPDQLATFIEQNRNLFTQNDFKSMCQVFITKGNRKLFNSVFNFIDQLDADLSQSIIGFAPDLIGKVKSPNTKLAKLALKSAYEKGYPINYGNFSINYVYSNIENPSQEVTEYYQLLKLYRCAKTNSYRLEEIYTSFTQPSARVTEKYKRYKLEDIYRYGDYWNFLSFHWSFLGDESQKLSDNLKEKFQKYFLIAAHERFPHRLKDAYGEISADPISDKVNNLYAILTAANTILNYLDISASWIGNTEQRMLLDLISDAKTYSVTDQQLFRDKTWRIRSWLNDLNTKQI